MANGWRRSFPRKQNMFQFKIPVSDLGCVRSVLAAGRRMYTSAQCATGIFLYFYQSGNQWNKTTLTWKCRVTLVLSEGRKWRMNLHFEVIFLIVNLRHWQLFICWIKNYHIVQSATNLGFNGWKRGGSYFSRNTPSYHSKVHEIYEIKGRPDTRTPDTLYLLGLWNTPKKSRETSKWPT
jgi:hypothetical protein